MFAAKTSEMLTYHQIPIETYNPKDGWVEQDPMEIMNSILECIEVSCLFFYYFSQISVFIYRIHNLFFSGHSR